MNIVIPVPSSNARELLKVVKEGGTLGVSQTALERRFGVAQAASLIEELQQHLLLPTLRTEGGDPVFGVHPDAKRYLG